MIPDRVRPVPVLTAEGMSVTAALDPSVIEVRRRLSTFWGGVSIGFRKLKQDSNQRCVLVSLLANDGMMGWRWGRGRGVVGEGGRVEK